MWTIIRPGSVETSFERPRKRSTSFSQSISSVCAGAPSSRCNCTTQTEPRQTTACNQQLREALELTERPLQHPSQQETTGSVSLTFGDGKGSTETSARSQALAQRRLRVVGCGTAEIWPPAQAAQGRPIPRLADRRPGLGLHKKPAHRPARANPPTQTTSGSLPPLIDPIVVNVRFNTMSDASSALRTTFLQFDGSYKRIERGRHLARGKCTPWSTKRTRSKDLLRDTTTAGSLAVSRGASVLRRGRHRTWRRFRTVGSPPRRRASRRARKTAPASRCRTTGGPSSASGTKRRTFGTPGRRGAV